MDCSLDAAPQGTQSYAAARTAGALLLLTAVATVVSVVTRVASGADQPTLLESLAAIAANMELYSIGGIARIASGVTLIATAGFVLKIWADGGRWSLPTVPAIMIASGGFTGVSGVCAVGLAFAAGAVNDAFLTRRWSAKARLTVRPRCWHFCDGLLGKSASQRPAWR